MDAGVVGDFRVERGCEDVVLLQCDGVATCARHDERAWANSGDERTADEHEREIADDAARIAIGGEGLHVLGRGEGSELATVGVAPHGGVECAEIHVRVVVEPLGEQDHAGTGAEHGFAGLDVLVDRVEQTGGA